MEKINRQDKMLPAERKHYPKKTSIAIKKTSIMIDELAIRREEEERYKLTPYEKAYYEQLKTVFTTEHPAEDIQSAIDDAKKLKNIRKDYLTASKIQRERQEEKDKADRDSLGILMLATGTPIVLIGITLLNTFTAAGIAVIAAGTAMYIPAFIREVQKKRKARKELKKITEQVERFSEEINKRSANIDKVCKTYGIPINCLEYEKYLKPLHSAAKDYETLGQKETDYELLVQMNGSESFSMQIAHNLSELSGLSVKSEKEYKDIIEKLEDQIRN